MGLVAETSFSLFLQFPHVWLGISSISTLQINALVTVHKSKVNR